MSNSQDVTQPKRAGLRPTIGAVLAVAACAASAQPPSCEEAAKEAIKSDSETSLVAVRPIKKGSTLVAVDAAGPITVASDMCLVKLLVGPGVIAEKNSKAPSYSQGIGIEIWLPVQEHWNQRIRNYGGGGWVGGGHRFPDQIGSKVPAVVNANMGYAVGTSDAGQPWYQDGSFAFLSNGKVNVEAFRDFLERAMVEQAVKTKALVRAYYGQEAKFAYFDGQSQGGRQGLKIAQEHPELYDGYMIAAPAINVPKFGTSSLYTQIVLKTELGFTAADKLQASAYAKKVDAMNARAVASCDRTGLGFLLDPFSCGYDPTKDAGALCSGVAGDGVTGRNTDPGSCMNLKEATALDKIWYGATTDGSWDVHQTPDARSGKDLGARQIWWTFTRGTGIAGNITAANADNFAVALQDVSYAADASTAAGIPIKNDSTAVRNKWMGLSYAALADAIGKGLELPVFISYMTDNADLRRLQDLGRKVLIIHGLADDAIPPAGSINYYTRVASRMGGDAEVQKFLRMYMIPAMAHSSQGRPYTVSGNNGVVPLPQLPGNANQNPTRDQDQMFSALVDWVEKGVAPNDITITSRDGSVTYPICVYPKMTTWNGTGSAKSASSFACR